ncbi:putative E3 ubiquitin-protein ligase RING1b isoform X2 [Cicer arietinum]|uniref:E3 ubiquitin-protein ligase RING1a isoform X2 n=1 Tax=Cicer arietinum TaxID=3827 RepID=A0A1S2XFN8_CICAR|nr:putative E3 ubiquitin-protein ligase RING1a isoform X2 [Cicer arietinum]
MPAQKRSFAESMDDEDTSQKQLQHSLHVKHQPNNDQHFIDQQQHLEQEDGEEDDDEQQENEDEEDEQGEEEGDEEEAEDDDDDDDEDEDEDEDEGKNHNDDNEKSQDSDETPSSDSEEKPEYVYVELQDIRKDVQCPICLGIIKKTRTVMECLHRFCRECIDKSMRLGNNECPACRTHCASRRSLRDDPNYDGLIATLYPNIEKYEEEELEFREEEKNRNKQIQASIAKVFQRQSEALVKRRKDTPSSFVTRSQRNQRNIQSRRPNQAVDIQGSEENEEGNGNNERDSSSGDERGTELRHRRRRRWTRVRPSQPSSSMASPDGGSVDSDVDISRDNRGISRQVSKPRKLTWGRGGFRSNTRHGSGGGSSSKSSRSGRNAKIVDHLKSLNENTDEFDVHVLLISADKETTPSLEQLHMCCQPTLPVNQLYEHVASQTPLLVEEVEILAVKGCCSTNSDESADENPIPVYDDLTSVVIDPQNDELEILQAHETLAAISSKCVFIRGHSILAYRRKV